MNLYKSFSFRCQRYCDVIRNARSLCFIYRDAPKGDTLPKSTIIWSFYCCVVYVYQFSEKCRTCFKSIWISVLTGSRYISEGRYISEDRYISEESKLLHVSQECFATCNVYQFKLVYSVYVNRQFLTLQIGSSPLQSWLN